MVTQVAVTAVAEAAQPLAPTGVQAKAGPATATVRVAPPVTVRAVTMVVPVRMVTQTKVAKADKVKAMVTPVTVVKGIRVTARAIAIVTDMAKAVTVIVAIKGIRVTTATAVTVMLVTKGIRATRATAA